MKDNDVQILLDKARSIFRTVGKRGAVAALAAWVVTVAGVIIVPMVPQRYEAKSRIYVDAQSALKPLMAGLTYQPDMDRHVRALARTAITAPNLTRMMERPELGLAVATQAQREQTLATLLRQINLTADEPGSLYTISYRDTSAERARRVVEATVELLKELSVGDKYRDAKEANDFITEHIRMYEAKLIEAERKLKEFKIKHFGAAGGSKEDYVSRVSTMSEELRSLRAQLKAAEEVRSVYRTDLAREVEQTPIEVELAAQRKLLNELLRRLGEAHPDVVSARELIANLEGERLNQKQAGGSVPTSPVYLAIRGSLAETEAQVASLRARIDVLQQRLMEAQAVSHKAPQIEAELAQLTLDHDVIRKNYDQLVVRRESALLGVKLDESQRMADFRILEPARASSSPAFPSHVALALLTFAAACLAAVVVPNVIEVVRPTFDDVKSLRMFTGRPVIGVVALVADAKSAVAQQFRRLLIVGAAVLLIIFQLGWLLWLQA